VPRQLQPAPGKNAIDREWQAFRDAVSRHPAPSFAQSESQTINVFAATAVTAPRKSVAQLLVG
jgi:hypothetical protein